MAEKDINYQYNLIDMHDIDCETFLAQNNPDALILAILCDFKGRDEGEVIHHIITELKRYHKENEKGFRESISMLEVLSLNRNLKQKVQEQEIMLSARWDELPSYEIGLEKAAINFYGAGASLELISQGTGLSIKEIKQLIAKQK